MNTFRLYTFNFGLRSTLFVSFLINVIFINAQPDIRKKGFSNPSRSDERVNIEGKKTFIKGKVLDKLSNEPLIGATVKLFPKGWITYTDLNGYFEFLNLLPDTFEIEVNYIGYKKTKFSGISTIEKPMVQLILPIEILVSEMEGVVIESEIPKLSELSAIMLQKNSNFIADAQSGNQIEKENFDYSVSTAFQRINGVSLVGKYTYIRGLPEKYNAVLLNNAPFINLSPSFYFYNLQEFPNSLTSGIQILKSTTSEFYANYAGGLVLLETEQMPDVAKLKIQWNAFYNTFTTFKRLYSLPFNRRLLLIPETQNIKIHSFKLKNPNPVYIPNYFKNRNYMAIPSTQWSAYYSNRFSLNNKDLGCVAAISFWDYYERIQITGNEVVSLFGDTLKTHSIKNGFQDRHNQNITAIANAALKWNNTNFLYSKNTFIYKNQNQVFSQFSDSNYFRSQGYERNFIFAQQNSGQHSIVFKKDRSLRMEWLQFYHYYYQQMPALFNSFYQNHLGLRESYLLLPDSSTNFMNKLYQNNLIYAEKQHIHQLGGDLFFDVMIKEEDNKVKTRIGAFINFTNSQFNSRNFHYRLNNTFMDTSLLSLSYIQNNGIFNSGNEYSLHELTDSTSLFQAQHLNFAPYVNIQYELTEMFHFVVGFREDFSIRKLSNISNTNRIQRAFQSDLPSLSLIFRTHEKSQLRFNYMMSIARPNDRDLIGNRFFHPFIQILQLPNPELLSSTINHVDGRFEVFPTNMDAFSINLFFKNIHLPIENQYRLPNTSEQVLTMSTSNSNAALISGLEMEWKQNLGNILNSFVLEKFHLNFNGYASFSNTRPHNQIKFFTKETRPLQGHSNYGFNLGFHWIYEELGLKIMSFLNHKGKNIFLAHINNPKWDIWELQRTDWSFQISKSYLSHWEFRFAVSNILNQPIRWAYLNKNHYFKNDIHQVFRNQKLGRQFLVSINYRL